jgi:hypothetical protein
MTMHVIQSLYSALAKVIGRLLSSVAGSTFLNKRIVWMCSQEGGVILVMDMVWKRK